RRAAWASSLILSWVLMGGGSNASHSEHSHLKLIPTIQHYVITWLRDHVSSPRHPFAGRRIQRSDGGSGTPPALRVTRDSLRGRTVDRTPNGPPCVGPSRIAIGSSRVENGVHLPGFDAFSSQPEAE